MLRFLLVIADQQGNLYLLWINAQICPLPIRSRWQYTLQEVLNGGSASCPRPQRKNSFSYMWIKNLLWHVETLLLYAPHMSGDIFYVIQLSQELTQTCHVPHVPQPRAVQILALKSECLFSMFSVCTNWHLAIVCIFFKFLVNDLRVFQNRKKELKVLYWFYLSGS